MQQQQQQMPVAAGPRQGGYKNSGGPGARNVGSAGEEVQVKERERNVFIWVCPLTAPYGDMGVQQPQQPQQQPQQQQHQQPHQQQHQQHQPQQHQPQQQQYGYSGGRSVKEGYTRVSDIKVWWK